MSGGQSPLGLDQARRSLQIIDAHHHFWDLETGSSYPWLQETYDESFFLGDYRPIRKTFLPEHYLEATRGWNVVGTVHCQADRRLSEQVEEDDFLTELHLQDPSLPMAIVAHVEFLQEDLAAVLAAHADRPLVRGIRTKPRIAARRGESVHGAEGTLQDRTWQDGLRRLVDLDFSWDLRVPYYHLAEAAEVIAAVPGLRVVVEHCGLPLDRDVESLDIWRSGMRDLASLPDITVKVSELGVWPNRWDPASNHVVVHDVLSIFGFDRSMFASNLPVSSLTAPSFDAVVETVLVGAAGATLDQLEDLFSGTARRAYRLS